MSDPWFIQAHEHAKFAEHFRNLNPVNGLVTGEQAKRFMLQSQLPPPILGQIWFLADTNADGKLDLKEFSIACKIINLKLHGVDIPKALPPSLIASLNPPSAIPPAKMSQPVTPATPPILPASTSNQSLLTDLMGPTQPTNIANTASLIGTMQPTMPAQPPIVPPLIPGPTRPAQPLAPGISPLVSAAQPLISGSQPQALVSGVQPLVSGVQPLVSGVQPLVSGVQPLVSSVQPLLPGVQPLVSSAQPLLPGVQPLVSGVQPLVSGVQPLVSGVQPLVSGVQAPTAAAQPVIPAAQISPTLPQIPSVPHSSRSSVSSPPKPLADGMATSTPLAGSLSRKTSVDSEAFNAVAAASVVPMDATSPPGQDWAIPQPQKLKYTQLFNATDRAKAGSVSGHQARSIMLQSRLPQQTLAQIWALADVDSDGKLGCEEFVLAMYLCEIATHGETIPAKLPRDLVPPSFRRDSVTSTSSYEERRRENFVRGQAELERRRSILAETQAKEKAERERKEREEFEKKERARQEILRKEQEEIERKRKEEQEKREAARREMERQCELEWEIKRTRELEAMRAEEQSKVLALKAKSQSLTADLNNVTSKAANLAKDIRETRTNVAQVKATIDGMRTSRDTNMSEMSSLKAKVKELNQKQIQLNQEKAQLDNKMKSGDGDEGNLNRLEIILKQLKDKVEAAKLIAETKSRDLDTSKEQLAELNSCVSDLASKCDIVWAAYEEQRRIYNERCTAPAAESAWPVAQETAWGTDNSAAWGDSAWPESDNAAAAEPVQDRTQAVDHSAGAARWRCVYEFCARGEDELSLQPGDLIAEAPAPKIDAEPGWRWGTCRGKTGWYPESYVEEIGSAQVPPGVATAEDLDTNKIPLEGIAEVPENVVEYPAQEPITAVVSPVASTVIGTGDVWCAAYPYSSGEPGDLVFDAGEMIEVLSRDGDWWTGRIGDRTGVFPSNYVQKPDPAITSAPTSNPVSSYDSQSYAAQETKQTTPICSEIASITEAAQAAVGVTSARPGSAARRDSGRDSVTGRRAKEVAQALANYTATSAEQLSLTKGQLLVVRKKADSGWWEGELQAKGRGKQIGWFPASYVKLLQSSGRMSGRTTPVSRSDPTEHVIDKVVALYPYTAQNADELSFEKDDIISVLDREQDPAWWQGEIRGMTGLFPSNYVTKLVHDN